MIRFKKKRKNKRFHTRLWHTKCRGPCRAPARQQTLKVSATRAQAHHKSWDQNSQKTFNLEIEYETAEKLKFKEKKDARNNSSQPQRKNDNLRFRVSCYSPSSWNGRLLRHIASTSTKHANHKSC